MKRGSENPGLGEASRERNKGIRGRGGAEAANGLVPAALKSTDTEVQHGWGILLGKRKRRPQSPSCARGASSRETTGHRYQGHVVWSEL